VFFCGCFLSPPSYITTNHHPSRCAQTIKPFVDFENCGTLFVLADQCSASQLMQYCAYFARKHQLQIIATLGKENVDVLHILATKARLKELQHACVPYLLPAQCRFEDEPSYVLVVWGVVALWPYLTNVLCSCFCVLQGGRSETIGGIQRRIRFQFDDAGNRS
jgi:hypothetical protein